MPDGDVAIASIVTGHQPVLAGTVIYYTMLDGGSLPDWLAAALTGFDRVDVTGVRREQVDLGSRYAPSLADTQALATRLGADLEAARRKRKVAAVHNAMTVYTAVFALLATGCRPTSALIPDPDAIDAATGFLIVDDKPTFDNFKSRLIWVSDACRAQLGFYHDHLRRLRQRCPAFADVGHDAPFTIEACGRAEPLTSRRLVRRLQTLGWRFPPNAGRHFLRSHLVGSLRSETLHALLGHWHLGTDPWGDRAGLDPLAYRAELADALPALLAGVGFIPRRGLAGGEA